MIDKSLLLLKDELSSFVSSKGDDAADVIIDNIGLLETSNASSLADSIVITLVNIEEESALKNQASIRKFPPRNAVYVSNPVSLNLYVLIACNYSGSGYILALKRLALVIQFIQSKSVFSYASSTSGGSVSTGSADTDEDLLNLKFTLELYTLTFEQINHLWGSLGGRQVPFVMYKLRLVAITERRVIREVPVIEEIDIILSKT